MKKLRHKNLKNADISVGGGYYKLDADGYFEPQPDISLSLQYAKMFASYEVVDIPDPKPAAKPAAKKPAAKPAAKKPAAKKPAAKKPAKRSTK